MSMFRTIAIALCLSLLSSAKADTSSISLYIQRSEASKDQDLGKALEFALTAVEIAEKEGNYAQLSRALIQAGTTCFYGGLFNRAVDYFDRALKTAEKSGDLLSIGNAYFNLGGVHNLLGNFDRSRALTEQGYQTFQRLFQHQKSGIPNDIRFSYCNNMGLISMKTDKPDEAREFFLMAIKLARVSSDSNEVSRAMVSLAELLMIIGKTDSARQVLTEVVLHDEAYGLRSGLSVAHTFLGDLSLKESDSDQALHHYRKALALARDRRDEYVQERVTENMASIFQDKGLADSAFLYLNLHHKLTESSEKAKARQSLLQQDLESRLSKQEQSARRRIRIERTILGIISGISLGLLAFFLFKYRRRRTLEQMEAALREEKLRLEKKLLQEALDLKDKQLAAQVMYSLQKNEMISDLVDRIKETATQTPDGQKGSLGKIIREIESGNTDPWKEFEQRFQEVHAGFYERLMAKYPDLTSNERRLCAFLRLDMSTKEISNLTGQSIKAITQARFRLRAKLGMENPDNSLFEVLLQI